MKILAIETSCDDTSVGLYDALNNHLIHTTHTQLEHIEYGGVVPELAARSHLDKLPILVDRFCQQQRIDIASVDAIAYTQGPGLVGPLLVGSTFARSMAISYQKPVLPVHHIEAHILVAMYEYPTLSFPFVALVVSGGHSLLVWVKNFADYVILGQTLDDSAGEAFDKCGKLLGYDYPSGAMISQMAASGQFQTALKLPLPLKQIKSADFSFSGLKTAFLQRYTEYGDRYAASDYAYCVETGVVEHLLMKTKWLFDENPSFRSDLVVCGGVAANTYLKKQMTALIASFDKKCFVPSPRYCTDNASMVAYTAYLQNKYKKYVSTAEVKPRWPIDRIY